MEEDERREMESDAKWRLNEGSVLKATALQITFESRLSVVLPLNVETLGRNQSHGAFRSTFPHICQTDEYTEYTEWSHSDLRRLATVVVDRGRDFKGVHSQMNFESVLSLSSKRWEKFAREACQSYSSWSYFRTSAICLKRLQEFYSSLHERWPIWRKLKLKKSADMPYSSSHSNSFCVGFKLFVMNLLLIFIIMLCTFQGEMRNDKYCDPSWDSPLQSMTGETFDSCTLMKQKHPRVGSQHSLMFATAQSNSVIDSIESPLPESNADRLEPAPEDEGVN